MAKLSVLYVVRNEQDCLEKSLQSIHPIADEIIVVDTGSFDRTISICRKYHRVKIFAHAWTHDYSQTKNYGIKQCSGEWILSIDADEMLDVQSASTIRTAVNCAKSNIAGFAVNIVDHESAFDDKSPANPKSFFTNPQVRIFRKDNRIAYQGRVFESVMDSVKLVGGIDVLPVQLHHFLWRGKGADYKEGRLNYYKKLGGAVTPLVDDSKEIKSIAEQTAIVIPAHNSLHLTKDCVASVAQFTKSPYNFYFVDNSSTDGTFEFMRGIAGKDPSRFAVNMGIAKAKNMAARLVLGNPNIKYVCFLDNDTKVTDRWLERMLHILEANPKIGLIGPLSNSANGPQNITDGSIRPETPVEMRDPEYFNVSSVDGFCMVMPTAVLRSVGLFDESFGQYGYEDKDLCTRVKNLGFDIAVANRVFIHHKGQGTLTESHLNWKLMLDNSAARYNQKWGNQTLMIPSSPHGNKTKSTIKNNQKPKISFVLLTHNRLDMTKPCVDSILATTQNFELIVVDNASTDNTIEWIKARVPEARIIKNDKNLGVPKARNQGIKLTTTDYVVLLDNDTELRPGWFEQMVDPLIKNQTDATGIEGWQIDHNFCASYKCQDHRDRVDYLGGALTVFRRRIYETVGLLDEGFSPAYYEDCCVAIRAKNQGFRLQWVNTDKVIHKQHATLIHGQKDFNYQEALAKSHTRFAKKMRGEIKVEHEILKPACKQFNILYLGMQWDYGFRERGHSFEHDNFYPAVKDWYRTANFHHFDFVDLGKTHGIQKMSQMLWETVMNIQPDVMFCVFFDPNHDPEREMIKKISTQTKTKTIGWFCDSHFRYDNFDRPWADALHHNVTTSASAYQRYVRDGLGLKVVKSQWGVSPSYRKLDRPRDIDVSFVGQPHGDRKQVIDQIRAAGVKIETYGTGWTQRLSFDGMIDMYNRSKINLNLNNACDTRFKQIKGRNFEVPGCGGFLLTGHAENLQDYFTIDKEIVVWNDVPEMIEKIKYYLAHEEEREAIAKAGHQRSIKDHLYSKRFDDIFTKIGLI